MVHAGQVDGQHLLRLALSLLQALGFVMDFWNGQGPIGNLPRRARGEYEEERPSGAPEDPTRLSILTLGRCSGPGQSVGSHAMIDRWSGPSLFIFAHRVHTLLHMNLVLTHRSHSLTFSLCILIPLNHHVFGLLLDLHMCHPSTCIPPNLS